MTWVAAETPGNPIEGFAYGTRVEWTLTDGTVKTGKIVVAGTDAVGEVHKILDDADPLGLLVPVPTGFVRRRSV